MTTSERTQPDRPGPPTGLDDLAKAREVQDRANARARRSRQGAPAPADDPAASARQASSPKASKKGAGTPSAGKPSAGKQDPGKQDPGKAAVSKSGGAGLFDRASTEGNGAVPTVGATSTSAPADAPKAPGSGGSRGGRPPSARRSSPWWRFGFPAVMVLLAMAIPVLIRVGTDIVLNSKEGRLVVNNTDPASPGWEAATSPTPTMLLVQVDDQNKPVSLTALTLPGKGTGGVILLPVTSVLEVPGVGAVPLEKAWNQVGLEGLQRGVEGMLGTGMGEVQVVDSAQWAEIMKSVGPLTFNNTETITVDGKVLFPKGQITVTPEQVGDYLGATVSGSNDLNRMLRQKEFWHALLTKLSTSPAAVAGENGKGLARFLPELGASQVDVEVLPVKTASIPDSKVALYVPVADEVRTLVGRLVPFPVEAIPGARTKVRILDGTGKLDHGVGAAPALVAGNGQIVGIGNATHFDFKTTQFIYTDDAKKDQVQALRDALGVGELVKSAQSSADVDATVILGSDYTPNTASGGTVITSPPSVVGTTPASPVGRNG